MHALGIFLTKQEVREKMKTADKDGSGTIDENEFKAFMAELIYNRN